MIDTLFAPLSGSVRQVLLASLVSLSFVACSSKQDVQDIMPTYRWDKPTSWFDQATTSPDEPGKDATTEAQFAWAEHLYWRGDLEGSFDQHLQILEQSPSHPLARFTAYRLNTIRDKAMRFEARLAPVLGKISLAKVHPLTAVALSTLGQRVSLTQWKKANKPEPFIADPLGLPQKWRITPRLSTLRLADFKVPFTPEKQASLADTYRSPAWAEESPHNLEETRTYVSSGIAITPSLDSGAGIHYMESFATVTGSDDQVFWVYGNFAAATKVWIDGTLVFDYEESDFTTSKRLRRIKLTPGKHRILAKMAYNSGSQDWIDLVFLNKDATPLQGSGLSFSLSPPEQASQGDISLLSKARRPQELEEVRGASAQFDQRSSMDLYLTALAAIDDEDDTRFGQAYNALVKRHPTFAPIHALRAKQITSRSEVPYDKRSALALQSIQKAHELDPTSIEYTLRLAQRLELAQLKDERVRSLYKQARQGALGKSGRLLQVRALNQWAKYLEGKSQDQPAEEAWKQAVAASPYNCTGATSLQGLYAQRSYYPAPETITPEADYCPGLQRAWRGTRSSQNPKYSLDQIALDAARYPHSSSSQASYVAALRRQGLTEKAREVLNLARLRMPRSRQLLEQAMEMAFEQKGQAGVDELVDAYVARFGAKSWLIWRQARTKGQMPLADLVMDGVKVAKEVAATPEDKVAAKGDEAYYAIDFAAARYLKDGSSLALTHTMVRVMTKRAIDRFAETSVPNGAKILQVRTIKPDGTTLAPKRTSGKSTLSMPGLAPGDFVEVAYVQWNPPSSNSNTQRNGTKFFFKMKDISSLRSEFVIINPTGDLVKQHEAPATQKFTYKGEPAMRFVALNSPRPPSEPSTVSIEEYLPWVQLLKTGLAIDPQQLLPRMWTNNIMDNTKLSPMARQQFNTWLGDKESGPSQARAKALYEKVHAFYESPTNGFGVNLSQGISGKDGSPIQTLFVLYAMAGFDVDLYYGKKSYAQTVYHPSNKTKVYTTPMLRLSWPGAKAPLWVASFGRFAKFDAIDRNVIGQPALCVTCSPDEPQLQTVNPTTYSVNDTVLVIDGQIQADGALKGVVTQTFDGLDAVQIRAYLEQFKEPAQRQKFIARVLNFQLPGSQVESIEILNEESPSKPLTWNIKFLNAKFARANASGLQVDRPMFPESALANYATLAKRTTPLFVGTGSYTERTLRIRPPAGKTITVKDAPKEFNATGEFGSYQRTWEVDKSGVMTLRIKGAQPIQRVPVASYGAFRTWVKRVVDAGSLRLDIR